MLEIKDIEIGEVLELVTYRQPSPNYARITIIRGYNFYARCINGHLQEWTAEDTYDGAKRRYAEAIKFEEDLGSHLQ